MRKKLLLHTCMSMQVCAFVMSMACEKVAKLHTIRIEQAKDIKAILFTLNSCKIYWFICVYVIDMTCLSRNASNVQSYNGDINMNINYMHLPKPAQVNQKH